MLKLTKVHIDYPWRPAPWGGGNQFLQVLRAELEQRGVYTADPGAATAIIFNSHQGLPKVLRLRRRYPRMVFVHRVDGPLALVRGTDWTLDREIWRASASIADAIIWQSAWSRQHNEEAGAARAPFTAVIPNAPDSRFFFPRRRSTQLGSRSPANQPKRLIAVSWSANMRKGFSTYAWLAARAARLGWTLTIVGNCPVPVPGARVLPPQRPAQLGELLRAHDIFLTASHADPCSNALLEGLACGLPVVARRDGGHPELVKDGGRLFSNTAELLGALDRVRTDYAGYQSRISIASVSQVTDQYLALIERVQAAVRAGAYTPRRLPALARIKSYAGLA
jgi:glycosyltransferase involved in cell wall biosynthesis